MIPKMNCEQQPRYNQENIALLTSNQHNTLNSSIHTSSLHTTPLPYIDVLYSRDTQVLNYAQNLETMYTINQFTNPLHSNKLKILQLNATGLSGKCDEILETMLTEQITFAFISETWLKPGTKPHEIVLHSFTGTLPTNMVTHQHHGLAILIHPFFVDKTGPDLLEVLHVESDVDPTHGPYILVVRLLKKHVVAFCYLSPTKDNTEIADTLTKICDQFPKLEVIFGDLNMRIGIISGDTITNTRGSLLHDVIQCRGFNFVEYDNPGCPTYNTSNGASIVDLFYATPSLHSRYISCKVLDENDIGSDHLPCLLELPTEKSCPAKVEMRNKWNTRKLKEKNTQLAYQDDFAKQCNTMHVTFANLIANWKDCGEPVYDHRYGDNSTCNTVVVETIESIISTLEEAILSSCRRVLGRTRIKKKTQKNWFLDNKLRLLIHKRRQLYDTWKNLSEGILKTQARSRYIQQKKLVQATCQTKKRERFETWCEEMDIKDNSEVSKIMSCILSKRTGKFTNGLEVNENSIETYSKHFEKQFTNIIMDQCSKQTLIDSTYETALHTDTSLHGRQRLHQSTLERFRQKETSSLQALLLDLKQKITTNEMNMISLFDEGIIAQNIFFAPKNKAPGSTQITSEMLLHIRDNVAVLLALLFTLCFLTGYIPKHWRSALLCPIFKKGNVNTIENYRPISLTETFRKLYETCLLPAMLAYIEPLSKYQNGFRHERNTMDHVATLEYICQTFPKKEGTHLCMAFLDIKSAYDKVNRSRLWAKLEKRGMPCKLINCAKSLFDYNTFTLTISNSTGKPFSTQAGLLQGSIISPLLYSLYIDDLTHTLHEQGPTLRVNNGVTRINCLLYADDIVLLSDNYSNMNLLLKICERHAIENDYMFNSKKCEVLYKPGRNSDMYDQASALTLHGVGLTVSTRFKYLGIYFNSKGIDNDAQITEATNNAKRKVNQLCSIGANGFGYKLETNMRLYKSFIRSTMEYGLCIMQPQKKHIKRLEAAQNYCLSKLMSYSINTSYVGKQVIGDICRMENRVEELQAGWILRIQNLKGDHLIKECLGHYTWSTRSRIRPKKRIPFKSIERNKVLEEFYKIEALNPQIDVELVNVAARTSTQVETSNRYAVLSAENVFCTVNRLIAGHEEYTVSTISTLAPRVVEATCDHLRRVSQLRYDTLEKSSDLKTAKRNVHISNTNAKYNNPTPCLTIKKLRTLHQPGRTVLDICRTRLLHGKKVKRFIINFFLGKFNRPDLKCLNCNGRAVGSEAHIIHCYGIPRKLDNLRNRRIRKLEDLFNPHLNRSSSKYYQIGVRFISQMLEKCLNIKYKFSPEVFRKSKFSSTNVGHTGQVEPTPHVEQNDNVEAIILNSLHDTSIAKNSNLLSIFSNSELPIKPNLLHPLVLYPNIDQVKKSTTDDCTLPPLPSIIILNKTMVRTKQTARKTKGGMAPNPIHIIGGKRKSLPASQPVPAEKRPRLDREQPQLPEENIDTSDTTLLSVEESTIEETPASTFTQEASQDTPSSEITSTLTTSTSVTSTSVTDTSTMEVSTSSTSSKDSNDTNHSSTFENSADPVYEENPSTSSCSTSDEFYETRYSRFKLTVEKELKKDVPMVHRSMLMDDDLLVYIATADPLLVDRFTKRNVGSIPCMTCRDNTLHLYNKTDNVGTLFRCSTCKSTIWNAFYLPLCYHAAQVFSNFRNNTPRPIGLEGMPPNLDASILTLSGANPVTTDFDRASKTIQMNMTKKIEDGYKKIMDEITARDNRLTSTLNQVLRKISSMPVTPPTSVHPTSAPSTSARSTSGTSTSAPSTSAASTSATAQSKAPKDWRLASDIN